MDYAFLIQLLVNGIVLGLVYALIATGLSLQFGILHIVNFAHGEFVVVFMYLLAILLPLLGGSYPATILALLFLAILLGWAASKGFFGALSFANKTGNVLGKGIFEKSLLLTLGVSIVLLNGIQYIFTATPQMIDTGFGFGAFSLGTVRISYGHAFAASTAIITFLLLLVFLKRTNAGRALRAVAQNQEAALMIGLDPKAIAGRAIILSVVLSAIAAIALVPIYVFQPTTGQAMLLKAFAVVTIGGMGNLFGAVVAALGLGIVESLVGGYADTVWQNSVAFAAMIFILIVMPSGLFPSTLRRG